MVVFTTLAAATNSLTRARRRRAFLFLLASTAVCAAIAITGPAHAAPPACDRSDAYRVARALDGDSLILADGRELRLIGINTPEYGKNAKPNQPLARDAHQALAELVTGRCVTLVSESEPTDRYGRMLAHIVLPDGISAEEVLLRRGLGWMIAIAPNVAWTAKLGTAETEARARRRGVWNHPAFEPVPAEALNRAHTGFLLVQGTVRRVGRSGHAYYFDLAPRVTLRVSHAHWKRYFNGEPDALLNRKLIARGWLTEHKNGLRMRLSHPAMVTFVN